jgi:hypothetical protein
VVKVDGAVKDAVKDEVKDEVKDVGMDVDAINSWSLNIIYFKI